MVFSIEKLRPIREGMTISRDSKLGDLTTFHLEKILL